MPHDAPRYYPQIGALLRAEPDASPAGSPESTQLARELGLPVTEALAALWAEVEGEREQRLFPLLRICEDPRPSDAPELDAHLRTLDNMRLFSPSAALDAREAQLEYGAAPQLDPRWVPLASDSGGNGLYLDGAALIAWRKQVFDEFDGAHALELCPELGAWLERAELALASGTVRWELDLDGEGHLVHTRGLIYDDIEWRLV